MSIDPEPLMTAPPEEVQRAQTERLLEVWKQPTGWRYWSAVNNSEVGRWYTAMTFFFFLFGGVLALLIRIQLAVPNNDFLSRRAMEGGTPRRGARDSRPLDGRRKVIE